MKNNMIPYVTLLVCGLLLAGGCANNEAVKKDEAMAPAQAPVAARQTEPGIKGASAPAAGKEEAVAPAEKPAIVRQVQINAPDSELQSALDKIYFDFDSSTLSDAARATLAKNAALLMKATDVRIRIEGNCDERGSAEYNLALGERRAQSAKKYLATLGVSEERLATISYGKERPAGQGHDDSAWEKDRRDEFVVVKP